MEIIGRWILKYLKNVTNMIIKVNGKTRVFKGASNVVVTNSEVFVNGKRIFDKASGVVELKVEGDPVNIDSFASVNVTGNVKGNVDAGGSVSCNDIGRDVDAGGSVSGRKVGGSIDAGGSVNIS